MNETVTKRFLLYFRLMLLAWILIANAVIHLTGMEYSWLIFLSNIMMFTLEGDVKDRFVTVELGGLVGLILTVIALLSITALTPVLGGFFGFLIPLAVVLFILITPIKNITSYSSMSTSKLSCRFCLVNRPPLSSGKRNHYLDKLDIFCIFFPFMGLIFIAPCTIIVWFSCFAVSFLLGDVFLFCLFLQILLSRFSELYAVFLCIFC